MCRGSEGGLQHRAASALPTWDLPGAEKSRDLGSGWKAPFGAGVWTLSHVLGSSVPRSWLVFACSEAGEGARGHACGCPMTPESQTPALPAQVLVRKGGTHLCSHAKAAAVSE